MDVSDQSFQCSSCLAFDKLGTLIMTEEKFASFRYLFHILRSVLYKI